MQNFKFIAYLLLGYFGLLQEGGEGGGEEDFDDNKGLLSRC